MSGKLVRDKIPRIIESKGQVASTRILNQEEYVFELLAKLSEEVEEFKQDKNREELADILEVLEAIYNYYGFKAEEIAAIKKQKLEERGGFKDRIYLLK